jgi:hypothetical protein
MFRRSTAYKKYCGEINLTELEVISICILNCPKPSNRFIEAALNEFTASRNDKWAQRTVFY